jgi:hypothetical protein
MECFRGVLVEPDHIFSFAEDREDLSEPFKLDVKFPSVHYYEVEEDNNLFYSVEEILWDYLIHPNLFCIENVKTGDTYYRGDLYSPAKVPNLWNFYVKEEFQSEEELKKQTLIQLT